MTEGPMTNNDFFSNNLYLNGTIIIDDLEQ